MKPAIEVINGQCSGCFGCYNICPYIAINMKISEEGFYIPIINKSKCNACGRCQDICPIISPPTLDHFQPICYAAWSKDEKIRMTSSSGGIFSEIAKTILEDGGVIYGVIWNNNFFPIHARITNENDLAKVRGSKYAPSYVGYTYKMIMNDLKNGKMVLFSGTPCQVAAINNVMKVTSSSSGLYTVDIVCLGVPSLIFFQKYLRYVTKEKKVISLNLRNKERGWSKYQVKIEFENGGLYISPYYQDYFLTGFLSHLFLNRICYECPFSKLPRQGDITLGDFWGAPKELHDERGVSIVLVNSTKGKELWDSLKNVEMVYVTLNDAIRRNLRIISGKLKKPKKREEIFDILQKAEFKEIIRILKYEWVKEKLINVIKSPLTIINKAIN
ncbi:MAG: Coenzyme F420 hydrogenase/dehydrogenase, beta subunit C-terminal domain [Desulfurococcaceae archaeon]